MTEDAVARRRFSPKEIAAFQLEVARGARQVDVARKHGFAPSNFRRWFHKYGRPHIDYEPTAEDRARAAAWRKVKSLRGAWNAFREFARSGPWSDDVDLPPYDADGEPPDQWGAPGTWGPWLELRTQAHARVLLICEKMVIQSALTHWPGPRQPSIVHQSRAALAWSLPLASAWIARSVREHARSIDAPIVFFGDLDPSALHSFAALRAGGRDALLKGKGRAVPVTWMGIDGKWLDWAGRVTGKRPPWWTISLKWWEKEYWQLVKRLVPDVRRLIGARGYSLLESGLKLEADALLHGPFAEEFDRRLRSLLRPE